MGNYLHIILVLFITITEGAGNTNYDLHYYLETVNNSMSQIYKNLSLEDLPNEEWKDIHGFDGYYQVSNIGRVKSLDRWVRNGINGSRLRPSKIKSQHKDRYGYLALTLNMNGERYARTVHRLVCEAFIPNGREVETVNHKNGIKTDNRTGNLEWMTIQENLSHADRNYLRGKYSKSQFIQGIKLYNSGSSIKDSAKGCSISYPAFEACIGGKTHPELQSIINKRVIRKNIPIDLVKKVKKMIAHTSLTNREISDKLDVPIKEIWRIRAGKRHKTVLI